jgi:mannan endo-1,6-alpha-mannosidase
MADADGTTGASNGLYLSLAAQLAKVTGNQTYSDAAGKMYDVLVKTGLVGDDFSVYDGLHV